MNRLYLALLLLMPVVVVAQNASWETFYEASGCVKTPRYEETIEYCKRLADASPVIHYTNFGVSPQGRALPLIIIDRDSLFAAEAVRKTDKVVCLVEACIHPGESDGKDAGLMLARDIAILNKYPGILDHVTVLFIPIFNVDGHEHFGPYNRINQNGPEEMGWRATAAHLNLNRDFLKADAPEMHTWLELFNTWLPEFFIDCHTTDGADYQYVLTYMLETEGGHIDENLADWQKEVYLPFIKENMDSCGHLIFPYVRFRQWHDPCSGLRSMPSPAMISQGYTILQNRPGLLIETHMLKPYKPRVESTYDMIRLTLELLNKQHKEIKSLVEQADETAASESFRNTAYPLQFEPDYTDSVMTAFLGIKYQCVVSDLTGGTWYQYQTGEDTVFQLPLFKSFNVSAETTVPAAYVIPPEWSNVIQRLNRHGIRYYTAENAAAVPVTSYQLSNPGWRDKPYEGRFPVGFECKQIQEIRTFPKGSAIVPLNQRTSRVIITLLEPEARGSLAFWNFFSTLFEQKEYGESYVLEVIARQMLEENDTLQAEFELKKKNDPEFAGNPRAILNWFYSKTPYWDTRIGKYPIGKIYDKELVKQFIP